MRHLQIVFSGSGGQGLMFIGKLLAQLALGEYPYLTFMPSYGAEVRGGTSNCQMVLSDDPIASPLVESADIAVLMNQPSVDRFMGLVARNGQAFVNSTMASAAGENVVLIPASQIAHGIGDVRAANVVMLGAVLRRCRIVDRDRALAELLAISMRKGDKAVEINRRAFEEGLKN